MALDPVKRDFLDRWAAENKCFVEDRGEVGFGRPCVGIEHGSAYVDLPLHPIIGGESEEEYYRQCRALPPSPEDAYHKHECLAVLVHGEDEADYDKALEQLYDWVVALNDKGFYVTIKERTTCNKDGIGRALELIMGGTNQAVLTLDK